MLAPAGRLAAAAACGGRKRASAHGCGVEVGGVRMQRRAGLEGYVGKWRSG
jgi:hypothetical protein